ncbi:alpha,alpha-trehalase TreF [Sphingomonas sp. KR1UV-12]|uniref:Alpha,alpha-trehalase TreF n=1 Tax=Sphingomonas aurea TaxID=3063994 RepID=A0ABT9EMY5_9SPHN|nr:alpha,alpha-trehalase TreF [Sphingomonas sp. KR1UV-12]MDP1028316.1 alpha,alpha-trehalase TreF [Sphingomonas sp. KR1UV-12]
MTVRLLLAALMLIAATPYPPSPQQRFGDLFHAVQMRSVFPDGKTFVDAVPKAPDAEIMAAWKRCGCGEDTAALRRFVLAHFTVPESASPRQQPRRALVEHIDQLWPHLTRTTTRVPAGSSALTLPRPYVVPGGRFREMYYWDSWFSMLGLPIAGRQDLVENMVVDFGSLIDRYGHIPNGTRTYYLSRSQPPFFYLMAGMSRDAKTLATRTRQMRAEHDFWMAGADALKPGAQHRRVVRLADGSLLNRYWDDRDDPRDESYREDVMLADATPDRDRHQLFRDLRAAAESGWDFSSRWFADGRTLATIRTTRLVPVDLNSLMVGMERAIAGNCRTLGDRACAADYTARAEARITAMRRHLWNGRFFADFDLDTGKANDRPTAAMAFALFSRVATPDQARATAAALEPLIGEGGLSATRVHSGQQWDEPNGWAPLQWVAIQGLRGYGEMALASRIRTGWLGSVTREYNASGKLLEKYDVIERRPGGGGEYPNQDGFGWTNGVTRMLLAEK